MLILYGILFLSSIQPIMMIISLILITLFYSLMMFKIMNGYWYSYMLMLVMLSGVLVVFTYMVSLIPNEKFETQKMIFIMIFFFVFVKFNFLEFSEDYSMVSLNLWFSNIGLFNLFLVYFLFSMMIMVVWLSFVKKKSMWMYL